MRCLRSGQSTQRAAWCSPNSSGGRGGLLPLLATGERARGGRTPPHRCCASDSLSGTGPGLRGQDRAQLWRREGVGRGVPAGSTPIWGGSSPPQASRQLRCLDWSCLVHLSPCPDACAWKRRGFGAPTPGWLRDPPLLEPLSSGGTRRQLRAGAAALASPLPRRLGLGGMAVSLGPLRDRSGPWPGGDGAAPGRGLRGRWVSGGPGCLPPGRRNLPPVSAPSSPAGPAAVGRTPGSAGVCRHGLCVALRRARNASQGGEGRSDGPG